MKKSILILLILLSKLSFTQSYTVSEKEIKAPSHIYSSFLLEMTNGTTILLQMQPRIDGFIMKVYDKSHEQKSESEIILDNVKDINDFYPHTLIELNDKAVFFYAIKTKMNISFRKLIIDPYSGVFKIETLASFVQTDEVLYFNNDNCFFRVAEDKIQNTYAVIYGYTENNTEHKIFVNAYKTFNDEPLAKRTMQITDVYHVELLDAIIKGDEIFLCLNKKIKPKASTTSGWFTVTQTNYIPKNKVSVLGLNIPNATTKTSNLELPEIIYSTKAQFAIDEKHNKLTMLLSAINPADHYGKIPETYNAFYKFSPNDLSLEVKKEIKNTYAMNKSLQLYPGFAIDRKAFVNFPQYISTDSLGNNTLVFQTVFNHYNQPDSYSDRVQKELAVIYCDPELTENAVSFLPYQMSDNGNLSGTLESFSFRLHEDTQFKRPRPHENTEKDMRCFEMDQRLLFVYGMHLKNIDKKMTDSFVLNRPGELAVPMLSVIGKNYSSTHRVFPEPELSKVKFNLYTASFNKATKTFAVVATEIGGKKERLVWIKFN